MNKKLNPYIEYLIKMNSPTLCEEIWQVCKVALGVITVMFLFLLILNKQCFGSGFTDAEIVQAIWHAEGGETAQYPYGIRSIPCGSVEECRRICFNTVRNNRKRYADYGYKDFGDFISFLGSRYCPIGAENDPRGLNRHWINNVRYFLKTLFG